MEPIGAQSGAAGIAATIGAAAFGLAATAVALALGRLVFPLDDAWIYLQYARTALDGAPFSYFPGEPATTGATSLLWLLFLVVARVAASPFTAAETHTAFFGAVYALHAGIAVATFLLAARLVARAGGGRESVLVPAALCVLAPVWCLGWFNGMETGLYGAALLAGAHVLNGGSPAWLLPLALARPEGAVLALVLVVATARGPRGALSNPDLRTATAAVVLAAATAAVLPWILTGGPSAGWIAKAQWTEPDPEARALFVSKLPERVARALWFGASGARLQPPSGWFTDALAVPSVWAWLAYLGGGAVLAARGARGRGLLMMWAAASLLVLNATAWDAQFQRYLVASFPLLVAAATVGWFGGEAAARALGAAAVVAVAATSLLGPDAAPGRAVRLVRGEAERMRLTQIEIGSRVAANLPADARVATHDVGAIAWYGRRPVVDLVGLVTRETAAAYRHGEGAMFEALRSLPPERRPTHAAIVPAWMPELYRTLWFEERLFPAAGKRDASSHRFEVWRLAPLDSLSDAPAAHGAHAGQLGLTVVDAVDVADLDSERRHAYAGESPADRLERARPTFARDLELASPGGARHAVDGGRVISGRERFRLAVRPDRPVVLVMRAGAPAYRRVGVRVGAWSGTMEIEAGETVGREPALLIPAEAAAAARYRDGRIVVEATAAEGTGSGPRRSYYWWALQPAEAERRSPR